MSSTFAERKAFYLRALQEEVSRISILVTDYDKEVAAAAADLNPSDHSQEAHVKGWSNPSKYDNEMLQGAIKPAADTADNDDRENGWSDPSKYDNEMLQGAIKPAADTADNDDSVESAPDWAANAIRYEWKDEYGVVGPADYKLEEALFGDIHKMKKGHAINMLSQYGVTFESKSKVQPIRLFEDAGLHPVMLNNVKLCGYDVPTPIQSYVLPAVFMDQDIIGIAQTGSGKTAAFLIPVISKLMGKVQKLGAWRPFVSGTWTRDQAVRAEPLVLIVVPTRELAIQIFDEARRLCYRSMLRPCVAYGGAPTREQIENLLKGCDILIATPGRLKDFMERNGLLSLKRVRYTIVDEADEMVHPDWEDDMKLIMGGGDGNDDDDKMYMMFSATFPKEARAIAKEYMADNYIRIRVGRAGSTHKNITQNIIEVHENRKRDCLWDLLLSMQPARTMIFVNSKRAVDFLDDFLFNRGLPTTSIHSERNQREREDAIRAFKTGKAPIIICTGVSARGIDISNVLHVINYELPSAEYGGIHEYVHRIGRTARIGNVGLASSFYNERNEDIAEPLTKLLVENNQVVPDFLKAFMPDDSQVVTFDDDTDNEDETNDGVPVNPDNSWSRDQAATENSWSAAAETAASWN